MKLSDIKGERAIDVAAELVTPIANIARDENAADLFRRRKVPEGTDLRDFAIQRLQESVPALLKNHRNDFVRILSLIKDEPEEEVIENMTILTLANDLMDLMTDDLFRVFFSFAQRRETSPESVQKNTEEKA